MYVYVHIKLFVYPLWEQYPLSNFRESAQAMTAGSGPRREALETELFVLRTGR